LPPYGRKRKDGTEENSHPGKRKGGRKNSNRRKMGAVLRK